jgi:hypothetical protein
LQIESGENIVLMKDVKDLVKGSELNENSFKIEFDSDYGCFVVKYNGVIELKDLIDSFSEVIKHPAFEINMPACYDFTDAIVDIDINTTEIFYHFAAGLRDKRGNDYQLAFVYSDEMTKTLVNFYRLFFSRTSIDVEIFNNGETALNWIKESKSIASVSYL